MKKIICYGDSNTFGFNPKDGSRYDENIRWTSLLQKYIGNEYKVINEGMCDRTGFVNNPKGYLFSAQQHFPEIIKKINSVDMLILSLGTNDLQFQYNITVSEIENGLDNLIRLLKSKSNNIIVIPPIVLDEKVLEGFFSYQFDVTSIKKSKIVGEIFRKIVIKNNCGYFDINEFAPPSSIDGLHYDEKSHKQIALKLSDYIKQSMTNSSFLC